MQRISKYAVALRRIVPAVVALFLCGSYQGVAPSTAVAGMPCVQTGLETLQTASSRYQPGQTVQVMGTGYLPLCNLTVTVSGPASVTTIATTDPGGIFSYTYQLSSQFGSGSGTYTVATFMGDDTNPWTSTTFSNGPYIETDSLDYAPYNPVTMSGSGWVPGEAITIVLEELDGPDASRTYTAVADSDGNFINKEFTTDNNDAGVHFLATATGQVSGYSTRVTFADAFTATSRATGNWNANSTWSITRTGAICYTNGSNVVTGIATNFLSELSVGDVITTSGDAAFWPVGTTVATIPTNTSLTLSANANANAANCPLTGVAWKARRVPAATDDAVMGAPVVNVTVTAPASINSLTHTATSGKTLTINSGQSLTVANAVTVTGNGSTNLIQVNGSFSAGSLAITGGGNGTSIGRVNVGTLGSVNVTGATTVNQNAGNAILDLSAGAGTVTTGSLDQTASSGSGSPQSQVIVGSGSITVSGNYTSSSCANTGSGDFHSNCFIIFTAAGIIHVGGNLGDDFSMTNFATAPGSTIDFNGSGAGSIPTANSSFFQLQNITVNKTAGAVATLVGSARINGDLTVNSGTFAAGGSLTLTLGGSVSNAGTIQLDGGAAGCGSADTLLIRSTVAGTQRSWSGGGAFNVTDVDVKDQAGSASITAYSSTNSGNNGANWTISASCVVTPKLTVNKVVVPSGDTHKFNLQINSVTYATDISNGGSTGAQNGTVGSNTFGETAGTSTSLSDYTTVISGTGCSDNGNGTGTITLASGDNKTCTITNTRKGHLIVTKLTDPSTDTTTQFSVTASGSGTITAPTTRTLTGNNSNTDYEMTPGTYSISETPPTGWDKTGDTCQNVVVGAGETKTCTITNTKGAHLVVTKLTDPNTDTTTQFSVTASGSGTITAPTTRTLTGNNSNTDYEMTPGTYSISETPPTGWDKTGDTCQNVVVGAGETKTCTITNTKRGHLVVTKLTDPNTDTTTQFSVTASGSGTITAPAARTLTGNNSNTDYEVTPGTYSISETPPAGWDKTGDTCQNVVVGAGETKTCTITNTKRGHVVVTKVTDPANDPQTFSITAQTNNGSITAPANRTISTAAPEDFEVTPGTYRVGELAQAGWDQTGTTCQGLTVAAGQTVTCTITNTKKGHLVVTKVTDPNTDTTTQFSVTASGSGTITAPATRTLTGNNSNTDYEVTPGTYSISETPPGGWDKTGDTCQNVVVGAGETKTCTITNTKRGHVVVTKVTDPANDPQTFSIVAQTNNGTIIGTANRTISTAATVDYEVTPGTYRVGELAQAGWTQTGSTCQGLTVAAGATVNCTITNTKNGHVIVTKVTDPAGDSTSFSIVAQTNNGTIIGTANRTISTAAMVDYEVTPGTYRVGELAQAGWTQTGSTCQGLTVAAGTTVNCTITNTKNGHVIVTKVTNPAGDSTSFSIVAQTNNGTIIGTANRTISTAATVDYEVTPGTYRVGELAQAGWTQTGSTCQGLTVAAGATVNCTITNTKRATLTVFKHVINNNGGGASAGSFTMSVSGPDASPASFPGSETGTTVTMNPGNYSVGETGPTGYARSDSADCAGTMAAGAVKACTITNDDQPLGPATAWIGLKNSDDQGTQFDLEIRVYNSLSDPMDAPIAKGLTRCITNVTRNPSLAKEVHATFDKAASGPLAVRFFTRVGTNADGTKCAGPGGSHNNAVGLRLYYDSTSRPSQLGDEPLYLHAPDLTHTADYLDTTVPGTATTKQQDSAGINFSQACAVSSLCPYGKNPLKEIGAGWKQ